MRHRVDNSRMWHSGGSTRVELTIALITIVVWVSLALPAYTDYVTRSRLREAHILLTDVSANMERHREKASNYVGGPCAPTGPFTDQVKHFEFSCAPGEPTARTFAVLATGKADTAIEGITYSVDESGVRTTVIAPGSRMADQGYPSSRTCWIARPSGRCVAR